mmetsp:Transcript_2565/g.6803  ORF Transcript_2565/g.6803 Transcript_2565/m.6803 type:complete len:141 (-) Transcript_2565:1420-1842(-)
MPIIVSTQQARQGKNNNHSIIITISLSETKFSRVHSYHQQQYLPIPLYGKQKYSNKGSRRNEGIIRALENQIRTHTPPRCPKAVGRMGPKVSSSMSCRRSKFSSLYSFVCLCGSNATQCNAMQYSAGRRVVRHDDARSNG